MPPTATARRSKLTPPADPTEIAARLRLSATRLARRLRQESSVGLTPSQLSALAAVSNRGPLTLGELADHERVAPPTITKLVAKLEADGLLERSTDPEDRRVTRVRITKAGDGIVTETRRRKTAWLAARVGDLTPDQQSRLAEALDVLDELCAEEGR